MSQSEITRRTFAQTAAMALGAYALPSLPAWAQGPAKKRNVVIGHTGITWPARPFTGRRGGGPMPPRTDRLPAAQVRLRLLRPQPADSRLHRRLQKAGAAEVLRRRPIRR